MRHKSYPWRRGMRCLVAAAAITSLTACGSGLESLPLPARQVTTGATYSLTAVFANAVNLPNKAKVKLGGADIGEVDSIAVQDFAAHVTMRIKSSIPLYAGSTAELRSATPLVSRDSVSFT